MRIKRSINAHKKHKKVLSLTKGYLGSNHKLIKRAKEAMWHAGDYSAKHRRARAGQYRTVWITRINAAVTALGSNYRTFISSLAKKNILLNRKVLADLALDHNSAFTSLVEAVK